MKETVVRLSTGVAIANTETQHTCNAWCAPPLHRMSLCVDDNLEVSVDDVQRAYDAATGWVARVLSVERAPEACSQHPEAPYGWLVTLEERT